MRIKENIASEFNEFSANYTNDMIACVPHYLDLISSFTKDLPHQFDPKRILDLGCGNGNATAEVLQKYPEAQYYLLDASEKMLELCQHRFIGSDMSYLTSYFQDYEFESDFFDMIIAGFSLHHCDSEEKKSLFKKIYKALKSGGIFGMSDLMIDKNEPEHRQLLQDWKQFVLKNFPDEDKWEWLMEHYDEFDKPDHYSSQIQWLKEAGFSTIHTVFQNDYWVHLRAIK
ncbi:MAG: class I SAM-dependent methyltransferase [Flavobacteriaceae bacterium]|nr:class I SAM-dependent methyltransferase [Flavobacteriaceae bacterium]